jgi:hypothetical protein
MLHAWVTLWTWRWKLHVPTKRRWNSVALLKSCLLLLAWFVYSSNLVMGQYVLTKRWRTSTRLHGIAILWAVSLSISHTHTHTHIHLLRRWTTIRNYVYRSLLTYLLISEKERMAIPTPSKVTATCGTPASLDYQVNWYVREAAGKARQTEAKRNNYWNVREYKLEIFHL